VGQYLEELNCSWRGDRKFPGRFSHAENAGGKLEKVCYIGDVVRFVKICTRYRVYGRPG